MTKPPTKTKYVEKVNNLEDCEHSLIAFHGSFIRDKIDLILTKDFTTGGLEKLLKQCAKKHLKKMSLKKDGGIHKLQEWKIGDIMSLFHYVYSLIPIKLSFRFTSVTNAAFREFTLSAE